MSAHYNNGPGNVPRLPDQVVDTLINSARVSLLAPALGNKLRDQTEQVEQLVHDVAEEILARLPAPSMQPAPATEQASGEEIYRQKARAWAKARYGSSDILSKAECDAAMHAAAEGYFAALRATQAERVQSSESIDKWEVSYERERAYWGEHDKTPYMQAELDARRATASKAEAIPDVLLDGNSVYAEITRKLGKSHCISADAVSTTLDAVVRLLRAETAVACNAALRPAPAMPVDAADTALLGGLTSVLLADAACCIEYPHEIATSKKRSLVKDLIAIADVMQRAERAAIAATTKQGTP